MNLYFVTVNNGPIIRQLVLTNATAERAKQQAFDKLGSDFPDEDVNIIMIDKDCSGNEEILHYNLIDVRSL